MLICDSRLLSLYASRMLRDVMNVQNLISFGQLHRQKIDKDAIATHLNEVVDGAERILEIISKEHGGRFENYRLR